MANHWYYPFTFQPVRAPMTTAATDEKKYDCKSCSDTHMVWSPDRCQWIACTSCPQPCERCRVAGFERLKFDGSYCAVNPCKCSCHGRFFTLSEAKALMIGDIVEVKTAWVDAKWLKAKVVDLPTSHAPTWVTVKTRTVEDEMTAYGIAYEDGSVFTTLRKAT